MKKTFRETAPIECLNEINRILADDRYTLEYANAIAAAHLLSIASRYHHPMGMTLEEVIGISREEGIDVTEFLGNLNEEKWRELTELTNKYSSDIFSAVAKCDFEAELPSLFPPGCGVSSTPESIKHLSINLLGIQPNDQVADFCCGTGGFATTVQSYSPDVKIAGFEINNLAAKLAQIRGAHVSNNIKVYEKNVLDTSLENFNERFDKIFCDHPFGINLQDYENQRLISKVAGELQLPIRELNADWLFNYQIIQMLENEGKAVTIMTRGSAQNNLHKQIRERFVKQGYIEAVIELPERIFRNTYVAAVLVVMSRNNDAVRFIDASNLYHKGRRFNEFSRSDITQILDSMTLESGISKLVPMAEFENTDYCLVPSRWLKQASEPVDGVSFEDLMLNITRGAHCTADQIDAMASATKTHTFYLKNGDLEDGMISDNMQCLTYVEKNFEKYCVQNRDLVISRSSSPLKIAVANVKEKQKILASPNIYIITVDESKADPYYIQAYLSSAEGQAQIKQITMGTRIPSIGAKELKALKIPMLDMETQKRVGAKFEAQLKRIARLKKQLAQAIDELEDAFANEIMK